MSCRVTHRWRHTTGGNAAAASRGYWDVRPQDTKIQFYIAEDGVIKGRRIALLTEYMSLSYALCSSFIYQQWFNGNWVWSCLDSQLKDTCLSFIFLLVSISSYYDILIYLRQVYKNVGGSVGGLRRANGWVLWYCGTVVVWYCWSQDG